LDWLKVKKAAARAVGALSAFAMAFVPVAFAEARAPALRHAAAQANSGRPAMWRVSDRDTTIYLMGTIHVLPKGYRWHTPTIDRALSSSSELVLEIVLPENPLQSASTMMKIARSPGLPPLLQRVPANRREALKKAMAETQLPISFFDGMKTWTAAVALLQASLAKMGMDPESGVERGLTREFKAANKKVSGLETLEQQFGFINGLPEAAQRRMLLGAIDEPKKAAAELKAMLSTWGRGDVAGIARSFDSDLRFDPELRRVLLFNRNARWAEWLKGRMAQPGTVTVAVGAGHLAGRGSVIDLLQRKGLSVRRVQ
jgi:uncharacterized protein YbaP (TraB family)